MFVFHVRWCYYQLNERCSMLEQSVVAVAHDVSRVESQLDATNRRLSALSDVCYSYSLLPLPLLSLPSLSFETSSLCGVCDLVVQWLASHISTTASSTARAAGALGLPLSASASAASLSSTSSSSASALVLDSKFEAWDEAVQRRIAALESAQKSHALATHRSLIQVWVRWQLSFVLCFDAPYMWWRKLWG